MIVNVLWVTGEADLQEQLARSYPVRDAVIWTQQFERFHAYECKRAVRGTGECLPTCIDKQIVHVHTWTGCVLESREENGPQDSDFYALVWSEAEQCVKRVEYGTTRYASASWCEEDATPDVQAKARAWMAEQLVKRARTKAVKAAADPCVFGRRVVVARGRNVPVGTVGTVVRVQDGKWGQSVLLEIDGQDDRVWTSASNVEVENPTLAFDEQAARRDAFGYRGPYAVLFSRMGIVM